mgnify:CR=1 FL=1|jgi:hypothetical protein
MRKLFYLVKAVWVDSHPACAESLILLTLEPRIFLSPECAMEVDPTL